MLSVLADMFRISAVNGRWDAPDHWVKRGPRSDWEVERDEWERNRRLHRNTTIR